MSAQTIYDRFRAAGMTHAGALAMLGNAQCESGLIPYRVQGDFSADYAKSREYTQMVDDGEITRTMFIYNGPGGGGYGLFQWTFWSRKVSLYNFAVQRQGSIGDEAMQVDFAIDELKRDWPGLWSFLCKTEDVRTAVSNVCYQFENPAVKNVEDRLLAALRIEKTLKEYKPKAPEKSAYWPPRMLCEGMSGPDVFALQGLLCARGLYTAEVSGRFDDRLREAVISFQRAAALDPDGIAGPLTWAALLRM